MMLRGAARMSSQITSPTLDDSMNGTTYVQVPVSMNKTPLINDDSGQSSSMVVEDEKSGEKALMANQHNSPLRLAG